MKRLATAAALLMLAGCERDVSQPNLEYMPDMYSSAAQESFAEDPELPGGRVLRAPPPGTLARGQVAYHYAPGPEEAARAARELSNPFATSAAVTQRGEVAFNRYCSPCHGRSGEGDGLVATRFPRPPSLKAEHARGLADGQLFHIITHGQGLMPAHGSQVAVEDRWKIVHYIRSLQGGTPVAQEAKP
jgi:mono/diheme cytochrome c family protein